MKSRHVPLRTCIICKKKDAQQELRRYVVERGELVCSRYRQGRGYYHCSDRVCEERFLAMRWYTKCRKGKKWQKIVEYE